MFASCLNILFFSIHVHGRCWLKRGTEESGYSLEGCGWINGFTDIGYTAARLLYVR